MRYFLFSVIFAAVSALAGAAVAQQTVWVQVEAKRSLAEAQARARDYAGALRDVNGFITNGGWYAIAIGPFARPEADQVLNRLSATGQIPRDSYIAFSNSYRRQFWPVGAASLTAQPVTPDPEVTTGPIETPAVLPLIVAEETRQQARQSERALTGSERELLQSAMKSDGYYTSAIDGDFGPGTRKAMAAWQEANRYEPTGVLTSKQRRQLVDGYQAMLASIGLSSLIDSTAGIEIILPMAMIEFDRFEPPFAHFKSRDDSGVKVLLISQTGDEASLRGLYDILQTLEIVPLEGAREIGARSFTLTGANSQISTHAYAALRDGQVKGFVLIWPADADPRRDMVVETMRASFQPQADAVLPDLYGDPDAAQSLDLMAGLTIRQPDISRSGFYIDEVGSVLTTAQAVAQCDRITLDEGQTAEVVAADATSGLALLRPSTPLRPISYARFLPSVPRLNGEISVSGYSYEGRLGAPTLTFGRLADLRGLAGERNLKRLALATTPGDAGGPVFDGSGSVLGMLLPAQQGGRKLPDDVSFATDAMAIIEFLSNNGLAAAASEASGPIAPEDLTIEAANMTVLVSCWN